MWVGEESISSNSFSATLLFLFYIILHGVEILRDKFHALNALVNFANTDDTDYAKEMSDEE